MKKLEDILKQVKELYDEKKYQDIINLLTDSVLNKFNNSDLYDYRANALYQLSDYDKAISDWDKAIEFTKDNSDAYYNIGVAWADKGDFDKAIENFDKAIKLNKEDADAYNRRGNAWYYKGNFDKAISNYDHAIKLRKDWDIAYYNRGSAWSNKGDFDKALADFNRSIEINQDYADAYNSRGNTWYYKANYDLAISDYDKAIELKKDWDIAYYNRGSAWNNKGEFDKAIEDFDKAIELNKDYADAFNSRGNAWFRKVEYDNAIADYKKVLEIDQNYTYAYINIGDSLYSKGEYLQAIEFYQKAKELDNSLDYLDNNIKLAQEAIHQKNKLELTDANQDDIQEKIKIENEIESTIITIKEAARSDVKTVVHYTKMMVAEIYIKNTDARMHYSNAIYMNDPMEGKVIFDYLDDPAIEQAYNNGEKRTETSVYLGSYLPAEDSDGRFSHEDELVMWRTYGKDENGKEAAGCSVVLSSDFFKVKPVKSESVIISSSNKDEPVMQKGIVKKEEVSEELLNVIYIIKGHKQITNDPNGTIGPAIDNLRAQLKRLLSLRDQNLSNKDFCREIEVSVFLKLSKISYLFKSADYQYENEVRVIKYIPRGSNDIKFREINEISSPCKRFHIESSNYILPFIRKIYLGPKVQNYQQWSFYFDYEIRQRQKELDAIESSSYKLDPSNIEILKSECRFQ